jgi:protein-tyrosine phosphatase
MKDLPFEDGGVPSDDIVISWLKICKEAFGKSQGDVAVAVHCVAGLGR